jgi:RHS repeat-associated protein
MSDPMSAPVLTYSSAGISSWTYFDGLGRTTVAKKKNGPNARVIAVQTVYNGNGTVLKTSLPYFDGTESPRYQTFTYDPMGRATRMDNIDSTRVLTCYNDRVTVVIDAENHRKRETKNAQGKLVRVDEYLGTVASCTTEAGTPYATTFYEYDVLGNLVKVKDAEDNETNIAYDTLGRKISMDDPDMGHWTYAYDANGNLVSQIDAKSQEIKFTYDALNRVKKKDYQTGTDVDYTYDDPAYPYSKGRLTKMSDATGTMEYYYDILGRAEKVVKKLVESPSTPYTTQTHYDPVTGRIDSITYPDTESAGYVYNDDGNLWKVTGTGVDYATYAGYNALGQPNSITYGNSVVTTYTYYSNDNRLKDVITTNGGPQPLLSLTYDYSDSGNVTSIVDHNDGNRTQTFIYDDLYRLQQANSFAYGALNYAYSQIGNITHKEGRGYTYSMIGAGLHAVTSTSDGKTYTYDLNGNMTSDSQRTITYDYDNMPVSVTLNNETSTFVYDGGGARVKKITSSGTVIYIGKLYECKDGSCSKYIFAGGTRIALKSGTSTYYYHQDHLGSTRIVTKQDGTVQEQAFYLPFGTAFSDTGAVSVSHKYTSQEFDAETGLYYYNARYYNPVLGRFISADSIVSNYSNPQTLNRYSYVENNPVNYTDPTGHRSWRKTIRKLIKNVGPWLVAPGLMASNEALNSSTGRRALNFISNTIDTALQFQMYDFAWKELDRDSYDRYGRTVRSIEFTVMMAALGVPAPIAGGVNGALISAKSGGDISTGILVGSMSGLIPSVAPFGSGPWATFGNQIVTDAIRGGVTGGVSAAMDGRNVWSGTVRGAATAAIAGQVNNAIGHAIGFVGSGFQAPTYNSTLNAFVYSGNPYGGITFGNVIYGPDDMLNSYPGLAGHEYIHTQQYNNFGAGFLPAYVAQFPVALITGHNPFTYNLFESDAQQQSGYPDY